MADLALGIDRPYSVVATVVHPGLQGIRRPAAPDAQPAPRHRLRAAGGHIPGCRRQDDGTQPGGDIRRHVRGTAPGGLRRSRASLDVFLAAEAEERAERQESARAAPPSGCCTPRFSRPTAPEVKGPSAASRRGVPPSGSPRRRAAAGPGSVSPVAPCPGHSAWAWRHLAPRGGLPDGVSEGCRRRPRPEWNARSGRRGHLPPLPRSHRAADATDPAPQGPPAPRVSAMCRQCPANDQHPASPSRQGARFVLSLYVFLGGPGGTRTPDPLIKSRRRPFPAAPTTPEMPVGQSLHDHDKLMFPGRRGPSRKVYGEFYGQLREGSGSEFLLTRSLTRRQSSPTRKFQDTARPGTRELGTGQRAATRSRPDPHHLGQHLQE